MSLKRVAMPVQDPLIRQTNFNEVSLGYSEEMAVDEAKRCINCINKPCISGCPVSVNIPEFINLIVKHDYEQAYKIITKTNSLPAICGRVCPQETQCEAKCIRGIKAEAISIGRLERFVADCHLKNGEYIEHISIVNGHKVAVIGSGPAGLSCANDLIHLGYSVNIFEALHTPGGVLVYGIPEFRLPKEVVESEIENLKKLGVEIQTNMVIGKILTVGDLEKMGYEAIFIGTGAGLPNFMGIVGEDLIGVYSANEFLTRINLMKAYLDEYDTPIKKGKNVAVIGGGNVAIDAARCAKRLGADHVFIIYRRSIEEMPARMEEINHAKEEGIIFKLQCNPIRINSNDKGEVSAIECVNMELGEIDSSGRRRPHVINNSNHVLEVDTVIIAIGTSPNPLIKNTTDELQTNNQGCFIVNDQLLTSKLGVYAGGDAVTGAATVILAMAAGKQAAKSIHEYLLNKY
ncbi:MAG: glutamate synthase homotetrameric [Haloplasmataceae bacterium]|jgi:glutamate synthase (NADPH/NADH) small chain|nr:glutamate synthase homotetrameric [Haloplasmataceae bacterium]